MRFATKFDRSIVALTAVAAIVSLALPARGWLLGRVPLPVLLGIGMVWLYVLLSSLPQYYEVRPDGLFLRLGVMRRILIPYASLAELQPNESAKSAGVFSVERLLITTTDSHTYLIAPADQAGFLDAVARYAPHLKRHGFGLAAPFVMPAL